MGCGSEGVVMGRSGANGLIKSTKICPLLPFSPALAFLWTDLIVSCLRVDFLRNLDAFLLGRLECTVCVYLLGLSAQRSEVQVKRRG